MRHIWKKMTNKAVFAVLFIGIGMLLTASQLIADTKPQYGGELRFVGETDAMGFDAIKARALIGGARLIGSLVMEKLFERGEKNELIPILGLSARKSEDGKVWTIKLRKGVKFHDGTPFNADAVVKHWQRLLNPKNRFRGLLLLRPVASVEKLGKYEVKFVLKHAWLPFLAFLTNPSGFTALIPSPKAVKDGTHNRAPVGTGPFVFKEWKIGDRIVAIKNHDYWQKGKPYLDKVVARAIPDHESRYAALISGQADIMITDRPTHVKKLAKNSDFVKFPLKWRGAGILVLNNNKAPLDDIRVRRALALAWDQKRYIKASFQNIMPYTEHWFGDSLNCSNNNYPSPDIAKARALIADYGKPVELEYVHSATNRGREAGIIMQQMFKRIGVRVNPVSMDFAGIMNKLLSKNFDITSWVIPGAYDMGPITTAILHSKHPFNMSGYANKEVEKLLFKQRMSTDPETRKKILCKIVQKVNSETPFIYLFGRTYYLFAKKNVKNVKLPVLGEEGIQLADIWLN